MSISCDVQVSLVVSYSSVGHDVLNNCKNLKINHRIALKMSILYGLCCQKTGLQGF